MSGRATAGLGSPRLRHTASQAVWWPALVIAGALCATASLAQGDAAAQRCRQLADPAARLACYDAAFPPAAGAAALPATARSAGALSGGDARGSPVAAGTAPRADADPAAARAQQFGFEQPRAAADVVQTLEAALVDGFFGWGPDDKIRLRNGQVWQVVDGSSGSLRRAAANATIRRGALGSYYIDFPGLNKSPRVRRLQ